MSEIVKKILFVEDDPVVLTLYRNRLQREGFEILFAEDGEVALNILSRVRPDLVVLDLMLPKVNGEEVLKYIRSDARLKATPVIILSNAYMADLAQKAMQSGANKGMLKTECTPTKLLEAIQDVLGCSPLAMAAAGAGKSKSGKSQAEAYIAAATAAHADEMSLKAAREEFIKDAPSEVSKIRDHCLGYIKSAALPSGLQRLNSLYQRVHFLSARAGLAGCKRIALLASAFEALLFEVVFKPSDVTPSVLQTIAQAVDCLGRLFHNGDTGLAGLELKAKILIVDDDAVCNYTMVAALKRAHLDPLSVEDPNVAMQMLQANRYDIVLLDINMPVMNGFELCERLRRLPQYKETPVIFITGNGDFQNRAQSILSGGNDLITKPTSPLELVLKTTMHLLQPRGRRPEAVQGEIAQHPDVLPAVLQSAEAIQANQSQGAPAAEPPLRMKAEPASRTQAEQPIRMRAELAAQLQAEPPPRMKAEPPLRMKMGATSRMPAEAPPRAQAEPPSQMKAEPPPQLQTEPPLRMKTEPPLRMKADPMSRMKGEPPLQMKTEPVSRVQPEPPPQTKTEPPPRMKAEFPPRMKAEPPPRMRVESTPPMNSTDTNGAEDTPPARSELIELTQSDVPKEEPPAGPPKPLTPSMKQTPLHPNSLSGNKKPNSNMDRTYKQPFDEIAQAVGRIIFGDENLTEMNVRLTRIALERYNVPEMQVFDEIAPAVARIIFGDEHLMEMNVRLTRIALERYNVHEIFNHLGDVDNPPGRVSRLAPVSM
jgi:DNA-binding response OmpR family regulator